MIISIADLFFKIADLEEEQEKYKAIMEKYNDDYLFQ